jgi:hypothetical protein
MFQQFFAWCRFLFIASEPPSSIDLPKLDPHEKLANGRHAESLLNDPMLNAVFEAVAERYRASWENAPRGDFKTQQVAHLALAALKDVQGAIRTHLSNAKVLEADLAAKKKRDQS